MQNNTDRRRDAIRSACIYALLSAASGIALLILRHKYLSTGLGGFLLLIGAIVDFGLLIPIRIILKERLKEIEGGEEDAAAQY